MAFDFERPDDAEHDGDGDTAAFALERREKPALAARRFIN